MAEEEEQQYLKLIQQILEEGSWEEGRNGKTKSVFGCSMTFSLANGRMPIFTTKKVAWKTCLKELLWFIKGETDNKVLKAQNVHIWDANGSREFLDSRGLTNYEVDELGPIYGYQWRHFNKPYKQTGEPDIAGVDQLQQIIDALKDPVQRFSRRLIMSAWNPQQIDQMALPPCHVMCQFNVHDTNKLSCAMYQRSADVCCGVPFNVASYSFLTHLLAKHCGLEAHKFVYFMGNCHIYESHIDAAAQQLSRMPFKMPTIVVKGPVKTNVEEYEVDDFEVNQYESHPAIKYAMVA